MPDIQRFAVFTIAAFALFLALVSWVTRNRATKPQQWTLATLAIVVVPVGMTFAHYSHTFIPDLPWAIYYGIPALNNLCSATDLAAYVTLGNPTVFPFSGIHGTDNPRRLLAVCRMA